MGKYSITTVSDKVEDTSLIDIDKIKEVPLSELKSTSIDILRTERKENDIFKLYLRLERRGAIISDQQYSFKVQNYGIYNKWVGDLVFAKGNWQEKFQPVTAASWVIHYNPRSHSNRTQNLGVEALKLLNPGLGLNSVMFMNDGNVEYGIGVTLTLFDDILQVGYGYNLFKNNTEGRGYLSEHHYLICLITKVIR